MPKPNLRAVNKMTVDEFRAAYYRSGESVMGLAFIAAERVTDDAEFVAAARAALSAEDEFDRLLNERGIER